MPLPGPQENAWVAKNPTAISAVISISAFFMINAPLLKNDVQLGFCLWVSLYC
jgi:hypothetical protein